MRTPPEIMPQLTYPVLKWEPGDIFLARRPEQLCGKHISGFPEDAESARKGKTRLFDAEGRCFKIISYVETAPFGSTMTVLFAKLSREKMYVPVLKDEQQLSLQEFRKKLVQAVTDRYLGDIGEEATAKAGIKMIQEANSFRTALDAVPGFFGF